MSSFAFKKNLPLGAKAHSTLSETMALEGDHVIINYNTEFDGVDLSQIEKSMRTIQPQFLSDQEYQRDVQVALDENYINAALFNLFYNRKSYSVTELLLELLPENFPGTVPIIRAIMNTSVIGFLFPELTREYGPNQQMDFRCAFNKDFLDKGQLENSRLSQFFFREGDIVDMDLNFGCSIYVYQGQKSMDPMQMVMQLFQALSVDIEDPSWSQHKSFFISMTGTAEIDFSKDAQKITIPDIEGLSELLKFFPLNELNMYEGIPVVLGKIKKFTPVVNELKVFKNERELFDDARDLNDKITNIRSFQNKKEYKLISEFLFGQGIPMSPFPDVEPCIGLDAKDSSMSIREGYAVISYDYEVSKSDNKCLFDMKRGAKTKAFRMAKKFANNKNMST
mmetsp:Transcript_10085/g.17006  ORF Transcript_10085/g.17006 Transcript_10085/m.17006 type:complete len:394 (+) Transcript_10085:720-1901(+)